MTHSVWALSPMECRALIVAGWDSALFSSHWLSHFCKVQLAESSVRTRALGADLQTGRSMTYEIRAFNAEVSKLNVCLLYLSLVVAVHVLTISLVFLFIYEPTFFMFSELLSFSWCQVANTRLLALSRLSLCRPHSASRETPCLMFFKVDVVAFISTSQFCLKCNICKTYGQFTYIL